MNWITICLLILGLLVLLTLYEKLSGNPILATFVGKVMARSIGAELTPIRLPDKLGGRGVRVYEAKDFGWIQRVTVINAAAITIGTTIIVIDEYLSARMLCHELTHVRQTRALASLVFGILYLYDYLRLKFVKKLSDSEAYWENKFEVEAREHETSTSCIKLILNVNSEFNLRRS